MHPMHAPNACKGTPLGIESLRHTADETDALREEYSNANTKLKALSVLGWDGMGSVWVWARVWGWRWVWEIGMGWGWGWFDS